MRRDRTLKRRRSHARQFAILAVAALVASACGGGKQSSTGSPPTTKGVSGAPKTTTSPKAASGEPVKVMQLIYEDLTKGIALPEDKAAVRGRIDRLNADGGVLGRPVNIDLCVAGFDVNKADECAQRAVDGHYLAFIGSAFAAGDSWMKIVEKAGIPVLLSTPLVPYDYQSPVSFPVIGGGVSYIQGTASYLADVTGAKKIVLAYSDSAAGAALLAEIKDPLAARGLTLAKAIPVTRNKPDQSADVQLAVASGDGVSLGLSGADLAQWVTLLKAQGLQYPVTAIALGPALVKSLGPANTSGLPAVAVFAPNDSKVVGLKEYLGDQAAVDPALKSSEEAKGAWASAELFAETTAKMSEVSPKALLDVLKATSSFDAGGLIFKVDFTGKPALPQYPRLFNNMVQYVVVNTNGQGFSTGKSGGKFVDPIVPQHG